LLERFELKKMPSFTAGLPTAAAAAKTVATAALWSCCPFVLERVLRVAKSMAPRPCSSAPLHPSLISALAACSRFT
jgi:hypothetical protein